MKRCALALVAASLAFAGLARADISHYEYGVSIGTTDEYDYSTSGTTVLSAPSQDSYSAWQGIPFSWSFYGSTVSGYRASDNGYITFASSPGASTATNTSIPTMAFPNHAIYAFWDAMSVAVGSGEIDRVKSWTYGESPMRVHVIQWYSVTPASGTGFVYAAIRLYECGDFDVVLSNGTASGMTATVGAEDAAGVSATQVTGSPNLSFPSVTGEQQDDVVYRFVWSGHLYDLSVTSLDLESSIALGSNLVRGTIENRGQYSINAFDLNYSVDGGTTITDTITSLDISPITGSYEFEHAVPWQVSVGGVQHTLDVWADQLNGSRDDQLTCNDVASREILSRLGRSARRDVLLEVFTGAWCGWCPDGRAMRDDVVATYGARVVPVDVHDGDGMEFADGIRPEFGGSAYPAGMVDRALFPGEPSEPHSRGDWSTNVASRLGEFTPVYVGITSTYDLATRRVDVTLRADFVDHAAGDMRFVAMVTEDDVTGAGSGYDQVNYMDATSGHPYFGAGDPIIGYDHRYVLRYVSSVLGQPGFMPSLVGPGEQYQQSFVFTLPARFDENEISIVGFVAQYGEAPGEREVLNVLRVPLGQEKDQIRIFDSGFESHTLTDWSDWVP